MAKIQAQLILEILGRPAENVKEALNTLVVKLGSEQGISILEKTYHDPKPVENSSLFTAFAEVTVELDKLENYFGILFSYMPAHIEILNPEKFNLSNFEFNELGNKIIQRLHEYDSITKTMVNERNFLFQKLQEENPELVKKLLSKNQPHNEKPESSKKSKKKTLKKSKKKKK
jgi:hypothetical protein